MNPVFPEGDPGRAVLIGRRLGCYQIHALLGAGGMGEVYRARDTRLGREVAIKVLPRRFAGDPERLARFEREARMLAALNHPNIAAVYGLEEADGAKALVLELVEGVTLAEAIVNPDVLGSKPLAARGESPASHRDRRGAPLARRDDREYREYLREEQRSQRGCIAGRMPLDFHHGLLEPGARPRGLSVPDALSIARQIAAALDAAHEKGIIHRDLKPANIKITPAGTVKVLDFGLAKLADPAASSVAVAQGFSPAGGLSQSPTITSPAAMTMQGVILGTAAYMSPEQARGHRVDRRTDIWAFGCVLYEMLTGRSPFARGTTTETLAAVIERQPDWDALPETVPPGVRLLLRRSLEKDQQQRLRDIGDARLELEEVVTSAADVATSGRRGTDPSTVRRRAPSPPARPSSPPLSSACWPRRCGAAPTRWRFLP